MEQIKRYYIIEVIDTETGEIIDKNEFKKRNLRIIKKTERNEYGKDKAGKYHKKTISWECKEHEQTKINF